MQLFQETAPETDACMLVHGIQNPAPKIPSSQAVVLCCMKDSWRWEPGCHGSVSTQRHSGDGSRAQFSHVSPLSQLKRGALST